MTRWNVAQLFELAVPHMAVEQTGVQEDGRPGSGPLDPMPPVLVTFCYLFGLGGTLPRARRHPTPFTPLLAISASTCSFPGERWWFLPRVILSRANLSRLDLTRATPPGWAHESQLHQGQPRGPITRAQLDRCGKVDPYSWKALWSTAWFLDAQGARRLVAQ